MNYYNEKVLNKFKDALIKATTEVRNGEQLQIRISKGNAKMGDIANVSLLPFLTCPDSCKGTCGANCYAAKFANMRKECLNAWAINTAIALYHPDSFFAQLDGYLKGIRFFRFHASGDILNGDYFNRMIGLAKNNPHCEILCFTKRFSIVNAWIDENGDLPNNLHILFSEWSNLISENPHNLPTTNIYDNDTIKPCDNWTMCGGNCFRCACTNCGCWNAHKGETIAFKLH